MKSLFLTTSIIREGTGAGIAAKNMIDALKSISEVTILSYNDIAPSKFGYSDTIPFLYDYFAYNQISKYDMKFDIVHIYGNPFGNTVNLLRSLNSDTKIIVDVPAHNLEESIEEHRKMNISYDYPHMINPYLWSLYTEHIKNADCIVFPSNYSKEYLKNKLSLTNKLDVPNKLDIPNKLKIIPYGCDFPNDISPLPDNFTVGHLSVFGPDKGQIYLLKAWANLGYSDNELWLAGQDENIMKSLIYSLNVNSPSKFRTFGHIPEVESFYKNISLYIQPSVTDGFAIEVLEAMSHGRPVIVTEGVGAKDLVINGINGYIVPIRNPGAITDKIRYLKDHPDEIKRLGSAARETSREYTWDKIKMMYKHLYERLTNNNYDDR